MHRNGYKASKLCTPLLEYHTSLTSTLPHQHLPPYPSNSHKKTPRLNTLVLLTTAIATSLALALRTVELVDHQQHLIGWFAMCPGPLWSAGCQVPSWTSKQCCQ